MLKFLKELFNEIINFEGKIIRLIFSILLYIFLVWLILLIKLLDFLKINKLIEGIFSFFLCQRRTQKLNQGGKIAIIGGGIAGSGCAWALNKAGY